MSSGISYLVRIPLFATTTSPSLEYTQPPATDLLVLLSFLCVLNASRLIADSLFHAGIIAELLLGAIYGTPLAALLPYSWQVAFAALGYLGLIGLVFQGGLSTDISALLTNLPLSLLCAIIGVTLPIALSFALFQVGFQFTSLEAFAAGSALASTSLGTTLMALESVSSSKKVSSEHIAVNNKSLQHSRIGTILISAAVIDDVIGLVLASLVPTLSAVDSPTSHGAHSALAWIIVRPILSSALMAIVTLLVSRFALRPLFWFHGLGETWCAPYRPGKPWGLWRTQRSNGDSRWGTRQHADTVQLLIAILAVSAFSSIAFYTGSSVLFGAYLAGLTLSYVSHIPCSLASGTDEARQNAISFEQMYARTIGPVQEIVLAPLFFASIGFSIPFRSLWKPKILWRGALYALLMCIAKLATGIPILCSSLWATSSRSGWRIGSSQPTIVQIPQVNQDSTASRCQGVSSVQAIEMMAPHPPLAIPGTSEVASTLRARISYREHIAPALFLGVAMVARGEIGLLVVQIAHDPASATLSDDAFLIAVWAILLCTFVGPIGVGLVVKHWHGPLQSGTWR